MVKKLITMTTFIWFLIVSSLLVRGISWLDQRNKFGIKFFLWFHWDHRDPERVQRTLWISYFKRMFTIAFYRLCGFLIGPAVLFLLIGYLAMFVSGSTLQTVICFAGVLAGCYFFGRISLAYSVRVAHMINGIKNKSPIEKYWSQVSLALGIYLSAWLVNSGTWVQTVAEHNALPVLLVQIIAYLPLVVPGALIAGVIIKGASLLYAYVWDPIFYRVKYNLWEITDFTTA